MSTGMIFAAVLTLLGGIGVFLVACNTMSSNLELAEEIEEQIDLFTERMAENHVQRMTEGSCTPNAGAQYLELSSDAERVADHLINVAKTVRRG